MIERKILKMMPIGTKFIRLIKETDRTIATMEIIGEGAIFGRILNIFPSAHNITVRDQLARRRRARLVR